FLLLVCVGSPASPAAPFGRITTLRRRSAQACASRRSGISPFPEVSGMRCRAGLLLVFATPALLLLIAGAFGQQRGADPREDAAQKKKQPQPKETKVAEQQFPPGGPMETAWKVEWDTVGGYGLFIKSAWFKRSP